VKTLTTQPVSTIKDHIDHLNNLQTENLHNIRNERELITNHLKKEIQRIIFNNPNKTEDEVKNIVNSRIN